MDKRIKIIYKKMLIKDNQWLAFNIQEMLKYIIQDKTNDKRRKSYIFTNIRKG